MRYPRPFRGKGRISNAGTHRPRIALRGCSFVGLRRRGAIHGRPLQGGVPMSRGKYRGRSHGRIHIGLQRTVQHNYLHDDIQGPGRSQGELSHNRPEPSARSECLSSGTLGSRVTRDGRSHYHNPCPRSRLPMQSHHRNQKAESNGLEQLQGATPSQGTARGGCSGNRRARQRRSPTEYLGSSTPRSRISRNRSSYHSSQRISHTRRQMHRNTSGSRSTASPRRSLSPSIPPLEEWRTSHPSDIIKRLNTSRHIVEELLVKGEVGNSIEILVGSCGKACGHNRGSERIREILTLLHKRRFLDLNLNPWIAQWKPDRNCNDRQTEMISWLVLLLKGMSQEVPESIPSVQVSVIVIKRILQDSEWSGAEISPLVDTSLNDLLNSQSTHSHENQQGMTSTKDVSSGNQRDETPDDFRKLSILPTFVDLQSDYKPFLRANIVNGCYDNVHHYLDVHFRLLREDFVQPLREGIAEYVAKINQRANAENKRFQNLRLYEDVHAIDVTPSQDGFVYVLQFAINNNLKRVRWELSKRLIYGSLVCLSRDDFKTFIFGYVAKRDIQELCQGRVAVTFNISDDESRDLFSFRFKMAESSSYFEAYRHVLRSLQTIDQENFPLKQYLISVSNDVSLPKYIREKPDLKFTLCCDRIGQVNKESEEIWRPSSSWQPVEVVEKQVQVSMEKNWPSADELGFDDSQMQAFKAALRKEICLIQGPPGTGKTYIGLKIVETLLKNKSHWGKKPLLVVCYTNHALDQFLEGILHIHSTRVVRIGGRSSSDKIKKANLNYVTREMSCKDPDLRAQYRALRDNLRECRRNVERCKYFIATARKKLLKYRLLLPSMSGLHLQNLERYQERYPEIDVLMQWLCIVNENGQLTDRLMEQFNQKRWHEGDMYHLHDQQEFIENADNGPYHFDYEDEEFDRLHLDDEDELIRDVFNFPHTAENENVAVEIPANYLNQHGELVPQPHRGQIDELIESKLWETDIMTQEEAHAITDICRLEVRHRWRLYRFWVKSFVEQTQRQLRRETEQFRLQKEIFDAFQLKEQLAALQGISVIGVTTTGAAKHHQLLRQVGPPIVIIEEAAEVLEAHVITSLTSDCQHLILIGDHQQLRPNPTVYELCKQYKLDMSLFERLIRNGMPYQRLRWQHRMRPEISHLLKLHGDFYPDLSDHLSVKKYEGVRGVEKNVFFVDHDCPEQGNDESKTHSNLHEAAFLISLCKYLIQQGYSSKQITILTAYRGQMWNIKDLRTGKGLEEVRVCPIDNFQGEENDIVLVSFVRSNQEGNIGFLKVPNRVCVALSRAKKGLYCVGNFTLMSKCSDLWKVIVKDLQKREYFGRNLKLLCRNHQNIYTEVSYADDFKNVPDGGCSEPCNARLNCGHTCQKKCHPEDKEHRDIRCMNPCVKKCNAQIHKCRKYCYEKCKEPCTENTKKVLPCSHEQLAECYLLPKEVKCKSKCGKKLPCSHQCQRLCYEKCTEKCRVKITKIFQPCGHQLEVPCFQTECTQACETLLKCNHACSGTCGQCRSGRFHVKCEKRCTRILVCGHVCESKCSSTCPPCKKPCENRCKHNKCMKPCGEMCIPCTEPCASECRHLRCKTICGDACDRKPCDRSCRKKLKCGHSCIGICGEPCPRLCRRCNRDEVKTILFGNEDEPGAKFILLEECRHMVEVEAMDRLMSIRNSNEQEIKLPECPWCKTPIRFNPRYNNSIKAIRGDVESVKSKILGHGDTFNEKIRMLRNRASKGMASGLTSCYSPIKSTTQAYDGGRGMDLTTIKNAFALLNMKVNKSINMPALLTLCDLSKIEVQLDMFEKLRDLHALGTTEFDGTLSKYAETHEQLKRFNEDFLFLLDKTISFGFVTDQEIEDWQREYTRCRHTITFLSVLKAFRQPEVKVENLKKENGMLEEVEKLLLDGEKFSDEKESKVRDILKDLKTINPLLASIGITEHERDMVVKAMGFTRGHWFKCPNGHVYAIGECGGAMQRSQCPECRVSIGGESHRLDEGNVVASEMDGALHPAYSEEANNMMNFEELM